MPHDPKHPASPDRTSGGGSPPPFKPTPGQSKGKAPPSAKVRAEALFKKFPGWRDYWGTVRNAAERWGVDSVELLALLIFENGRADPNAVSSAGALGLAQILDQTVRRDLNPTQYQTFIAEWGELAPERKRDPAYSIHYAAWRMAGTRAQYGSLDAWYTGNYNPGFKGDKRGPGPSVYVGRYQPKPPQTPTQAAAASVEREGARQVLTDPWVALVTKGGRIAGVRYVQGDPPANVLVWNGTPITRSEFLRLKTTLEETFVAYTGKRPSDAQVAAYARRGWSNFTLARVLTASPSFFQSPVWKTRAPDYKAMIRDVYGDNAYDPAKHRELVRDAIFRNLSGQGFLQVLRQRPDYVESNEFKGKVALLLPVHTTIYGKPDEGAMKAIREAAIGGWDVNQYAAWLRSQPEYSSSPEYRGRVLSFLETLGFVVGETPVLKPGTPAPDSQPSVGTLPDDKRIPGQGRLSRPSNLVPTFGGTP